MPSAFCSCVLHSDQPTACTPPAWLSSHTGRAGEIYFKMQDSAWGNAMMHLRDSLAIALMLDRTPVLVVDDSWRAMYGTNLSSLLEVLPRASVVSAPRVASLHLPHTIASVEELDAALHSPPPASTPLYTRLDWWFNTGNVVGLLDIARRYRQMPWSAILLDDVPPCWTSAFVRPSRRLRDAVLQRLQGTCASVHLRLCSKLGWLDSCDATADPERTAREMTDCACADSGSAASSRVFIALDSETTLASLARDRPGRLVTFADISPVEHSSKSSSGGGGRRGSGRRPVMRPRRKALSPAALWRVALDWAAYAYSPSRVLALPSSFVASAVCAFRPDGHFAVFARPSVANTSIDCGRPLARGWGPRAHPCKVDPKRGATWAHAGMPTPASQQRQRGGRRWRAVPGSGRARGPDRGRGRRRTPSGEKAAKTGWLW